ncbi:hypothetical protein ACWD5V_08220 [Streptomyces sp. NPDC002523]
MNDVTDPAIEVAISREIGELEEWTEGRLSKVEVLHVAHARNMAGLELCPNLRSLILVGCDVPSVRLIPQLPRLMSLAIEDSSLTDLHGVEDSSVHALELRRNLLEDLSPVGRMPSLESLDVSGNPLNDEAVGETLPELRARGIRVTSSDEVETALTRRMHESGLPYAYYRSTMGHQLSRPGLALTERPEADHPFVGPAELEALLDQSSSAVEALFEDENRMWPPIE